MQQQFENKTKPTPSPVYKSKQMPILNPLSVAISTDKTTPLFHWKNFYEISDKLVNKSCAGVYVIHSVKLSKYNIINWEWPSKQIKPSPLPLKL